MAGKVSFQIFYSKLLLNRFYKQTKEWLLPRQEQILKVRDHAPSLLVKCKQSENPPFPKSIICKRMTGALETLEL